MIASLASYFIELLLDSYLWGSKKQGRKVKRIQKIIWRLSLPFKRILYTIRFGISYRIDRINNYKYILKVHYNDQTSNRMWILQDKYTRWIIMESSWFETEYECKNRAKAYLWINRLFCMHKEGTTTFYSIYLSDKDFWKKIKKNINTISFSFITDAKDK